MAEALGKLGIRISAVIKLGQVLVLACVLAGLCVVPSLAHADAAADYRAAVLADNPVSYWRLNDTSGSTAVDEENHNPGQISGATLNEPGPMAGDASMRFEGNGVVELGHDESLRPPESWTLELWFKASANEAAQCAPNFGPVCDLYRYHAFGFVLQLQTDGQISAGVDTDNQTSVGVTSPDSYADNQWHYAVVVRSQGNVSLSIDGTEVANAPTASSATYYCCEDVAAIANDGACHCESFTGWMSEVAFYNYPLSATQIKAHYLASGVNGGSGQTGLVSEWRGNGNANDSVGISNGVLVDGDYAPGRSGQAFNLDGVDDYVSIPSTAMANVTGAISVSAWVNPVSLPATEGAIILSQYDTHDTETSFDIELMPGGHIEWEVTGAGCDSLRGDARVVESAASIVAGQWTQVAGAYDPTTEQLEILINGQPVATQMIESASVPSLCRSNTPLRIGAAQAIGGELGDFFDGEIEDVQLYNTDIGGTGGGSGGSLSCAPTSTAPTLANLSAQICQLVEDESTIVKQQGVFLGVVGTFPHVSPTDNSNWTLVPIATVPGSEADTTQAAMKLMEDALNDFGQEVAGMVVDKIAEAYPDVVQAVHDFGSAEDEDLSAAMEELEAAKAVVDSLGGLTATSLAEIAYHSAAAAFHLAKKLEALQKALEKLKAELENNGQGQTQEQIELEAELVVCIKAIAADTTTLQTEMSQILLVPQGGYDIFPGLPVNEFSPGSGATVVVDPGNFTNGVLTSNLNPVGLSSSAVVNLPTVPSPTINTSNLNVDSTLSISSSNFGSSTSTEIGLGSSISLDSGASGLPFLLSGGPSFRARAASATPEPTASSEPVRLAVVKTSSKGSFTTRVTIPADVASGKHELYVIGTAPNGSPRLLETDVTISTPPTVTNLTQSHRRWREGDKLAQTSRKRRLPVGTIFSFTLNEPAKVSLAFVQPVRGHRTKGRCVTQARKNHRKHSCKRAVARGTLTFTGHAGVNKVSFQGRISRQPKLKPGSFTLMLTAAGTNGRSSPKTLGFTIVK
jgi:hypothetical protein